MVQRQSCCSFIFRNDSPNEARIIKIAVANYSYLGTIAEPIKQRLAQSDQKCEFIEKSQEEIQKFSIWLLKKDL